MPPLLQAFAPPLALLSLLYAFVMKLRAWFYDVGVLPSDSSGAFVVSIGNIQAGGTGKTPIVEFFARRWSDRTRLGIVSRGYGRKTRGSQRVSSAGLSTATGKLSAAEAFGDEPSWLFEALNRQVPVQVGERRLEAARDLAVSEGTKLLLLDDGFQHLALRRSYDIVLLDVSAPRWHWHVLPWGRLREPVSALRRADVVILTKTELVSEDRLKDFERQALRWAGRQIPILRFRQQISWGPSDLESQKGEKIILAAGLANPGAFFEAVRNHESKPTVVRTFSYRDHYAYKASDVERLKSVARETGATRVLVTEKDAVKLRPLWDASGVELAVSKLEVRPVREFDKEQLEQIDEVIFSEMRGQAGRAAGTGSEFSNRLSST